MTDVDYGAVRNVLDALGTRRVRTTLMTAIGVPKHTFELVAEQGPAPSDLDPLFAALQPDPEETIDGVLDVSKMPLDEEPPPSDRM